MQDLFQDLETLFLIGKPHNRERGERPPAHGVNIAECIGGRNLAKSVGIVYDRSEEINRLDQRQVGRQLIHSRVVVGLKAHQDIWVGLFRQLGQHAVQNTWTQLGRSTRRFHQARQTNWRHRQLSVNAARKSSLAAAAKSITKAV